MTTSVGLNAYPPGNFLLAIHLILSGDTRSVELTEVAYLADSVKELGNWQSERVQKGGPGAREE